MKHISPRIVLATLGLMSVSVGFAVHAATRYTEMVDGDEISVRRPSEMDYDPFAMRPKQKQSGSQVDDPLPQPAATPPPKPTGTGFVDPKQFIMPTGTGDGGIVRLPAVRPSVERVPSLTPLQGSDKNPSLTKPSTQISRLPTVRIPSTDAGTSRNRNVSMDSPETGDIPIVRANELKLPTTSKPKTSGASSLDDDIPVISAADAGPRPDVFARNNPSNSASSNATPSWSSGSEGDGFAAPLTIEADVAGSQDGDFAIEALPPVVATAEVPASRAGSNQASWQNLANGNTGNNLPEEVSFNRNAGNEVQQASPWQTTQNPLSGSNIRLSQGEETQGWNASIQSTGNQNNLTTENKLYANRSQRTQAAADAQPAGYGQVDVQPVTQTTIDQPMVAYEPINQAADQQQEIVQFSEALQFQNSPSDRRVSGSFADLSQASLTAEAVNQYPIEPQSQGGATPRIAPDGGYPPYDSPLSNLTQGSSSIEDDLITDAFDPGSWGAPCPGGCPSKFYAKADMVAYQPEISPFSLSSAISTDQSFFREGGRVTFGYRGDCLVGWEASALILSNASEVVSSTNQGISGPLGVRFVPESGFTNVNLTSFGAPNGLVHIQDHRQEFSTYEFNRVTWGWDVLNTMIGVRVTHFQEDVRLGAGPTALPLENMPGLFRHNVDNLLLGPQIGMTLIDDSRELLTFDFRGRLGGYVNLMEADTQFVNEGITYINRNNIQDAGFAASVDFTAGVALRITRNIHVRAGLDAMYYYGMATASEQLINSAVPGAVRLTPGTGSSIQNEDDLFYIGGTIGVYGNWP